MPRENLSVLAFNRGIISSYGLARVDLKRASMSAEEQTNWMPRVLGSMSLRPGWAYIGATKSNAVARTIPFVFATDDTAHLEITSGALRVRVDDALVTRPTVTTTITNGTFLTDVTGWTDADESTAASSWETGGYLKLVGTGTAAAIRTQQVTVSGGNIGVEHALRIVIARGPVVLRVGSTAGDDDYIGETTLGTGTHSLAFTPTGDFHVQLKGTRVAATLVDSITVEAAGTLELPTPWPEDCLTELRFTQSADVIYICCDGYQQRKIERRAARSWSVVAYEPEVGPFRALNLTPITITPSDTVGDITLTASANLFKSTHVGALFRLQSSGQEETASLSGADQYTDPVRVTGVGGQRAFSVILVGTFSATLTLQYSVGAIGSWVDYGTYTTETAVSINDGLDNQVIYYRIGIKGGGYTSGTVDATLAFSSGSIVGVARVTGYTSPTVVNASVLDNFGAATATADWWEGAWSERRGWPSAVAFHEGRLWWFGKNRIFGSVSDDYENFNDQTEGDAGPIIRTIGEGPVDNINWAMPLQRLILGTPSAELVAKSSALDEPMTPTNFNLKPASTQGSARVDAIRVDKRGIFTQRSGSAIFETAYNTDSYEYETEELTLLVPDLHDAGIRHLAVQRQPDTRIHVVRNDGTVAVLVYDRAENVLCWVELETDGYVEDVSVLPGALEDDVYYVVRRTINGSTVRYVEKWAQESECVGGSLNKQADAFIVSSGTTITGLGHLEGETVVAWGDGRDLGEYTVSGGAITLSAATTTCVVGLPYEARFKGMKLATQVETGSPLNLRKRIEQIGLICKDTHYQGLEFGPDFDTMDPLPAVEDGAETEADTVWPSYDHDLNSFPGGWSTDSRLCLRARAPRPATVLACTIVVNTTG